MTARNKKGVGMPRPWKGILGVLLMLATLSQDLYAEDIVWYQMDFPPA